MTLHEYENQGEDISGTGTVQEFTVGSYGFAEIQLENGGAAADYEFQVSDSDGDNWYTGKSWSQVTDIDDTLELVAGKVRLQITTGAGGSNTADVLFLFDDSGE